MYQPSLNTEPLATQRLVEAREFAGSPLRIVDGGSRWGHEDHWSVYGEQVDVLAFEPDDAECGRLVAQQAAKPGGRMVHYFPVALGGAKEERLLHLANMPDASSLLPTNHTFVDRFAMAESLTQVRDVPVPVTDLESLADEQEFAYIDFMKLDVEGLELEVLKGGERFLRDSVVGLSVEVWFHPEHLGRPLFADIDAYLREFDFALFDLREVNRWRRKTLAGDSYATQVGSGQVMYANALYFRDLPALVASRQLPGPLASRVQFLKAISVAELFCYSDFALEVLHAGVAADALDADDSRLLEPLLGTQFVTARQGWPYYARKSIRAVVPPVMRRRLAQAFSTLVAD